MRKGRVMSDLEFETRLDRLFAEPPHFKDAELFARHGYNEGVVIEE